MFESSCPDHQEAPFYGAFSFCDRIFVADILCERGALGVRLAISGNAKFGG